MICATYGYRLHEVRAMDGDEFFLLFEQAHRVRAFNTLAAIQSVSAGMAGGESAKDLVDELMRQIDGLPKLRIRDDYAQSLAQFVLAG